MCNFYDFWLLYINIFCLHIGKKNVRIYPIQLSLSPRLLPRICGCHFVFFILKKEMPVDVTFHGKTTQPLKTETTDPRFCSGFHAVFCRLLFGGWRFLPVAGCGFCRLLGVFRRLPFFIACLRLQFRVYLFEEACVSL